MKTILLLSIICLAILPAFSQTFNITYTSNCTESSNLEEVYKNDIYRLAIDRVNQINSPWKDSVDIPQIFLDSIANAFYAIHNMQWSETKDSILTLFGQNDYTQNAYLYSITDTDSTHYSSINTSGFSPKKFQLGIFPNASFLNDWANHNYNNTTNAQVNALMNKYNLNVSFLYSIPSVTVYYIHSSKAINIKALMAKFLAISEIKNGYQYGYTGDGPRLNAVWNSNGINFTYTHSCGDCPSGCTYGRHWNFEINTSTNCSVKYTTANNWGGTPNQWNLGYPYTCAGTILSNGITNLTGTLKNNNAVIEWKNSTENNLSGYEMERSSNGINFIKIGAVPVSASQSAVKNYAFVDHSILGGTGYYRVKLLNASGSFGYSSIIKLSPDKTLPGLHVYPNPVSDKKLNLQLQNAKGSFSLDVYDLLGKKVFSQQINSNSETFTTSIQLPNNLSSGNYFLVMQNEKHSFKQTVIIQ